MLERLRARLVAMKKAAPGGDEQFKAAAATLLKYLGAQCVEGGGRGLKAGRAS